MGRTIEEYKNKNFTEDQLKEIEEGIRDGVDVDLYADPEFLSMQMHEIHIGQLEGLAVENYAKKEFDWLQMKQIRLGLEADVDVKKYANPKLSFEVMRQVRIGLSQGVDLSPAVNLPAGTLRELRKAMISKVSILQYIRDGYVQERLEEIRLALEEELNIDPFLNKEFRGASIRKIRLGLEDNLPVERYMSFMHTANEMKHIREMLLQEREAVSQYDEIEDYNFKGFSLLVSADEMSARLLIHEHSQFLSKDKILDALAQSNVTEGIDENAIEQTLKDGHTGETVEIAHGREAVKGEDGWYEYFFDTSAQKSPKLQILLSSLSIICWYVREFETQWNFTPIKMNWNRRWRNRPGFCRKHTGYWNFRQRAYRSEMAISLKSSVL